MSTSSPGIVGLFGHEPETYRPHVLHTSDRTYPETNCYTDVLIELLHARGDDPVAVMGSTIRMDFEGDQWTFFKPHPGDLELLFGVDIHEMQPYRPIAQQIDELIERGHTLIVELDAWYLPDTAGTSYRSEHVKTSVAAEAIDTVGERLRYYHNTSLHELEGEDFCGALRIGTNFPGDVLPPYTELVRFDGRRRLAGAELNDAARALLRGHLDRAPTGNPFLRFGERLQSDLPALLDGEASAYHDYAFATVRMAGAGFELCAAHLDWLLGADAAEAGTAMGRIVEASKLLGFKLARRREFDADPVIAQMAEAWDQAVATLDAALR